MCEEISRCYADVNVCLWTDGSQLTQSAAKTACQRRNNSFLPRVTNSVIQDKLAVFRAVTGNLLGGSGFWIDVKSVGISSSLYWIDGSSMIGLFSSTHVYDVIHYCTLLVRTVHQIKFIGSRMQREWLNHALVYI